MVTIFYLYNHHNGDIHNNAFTKYESAIEELKEIGGTFDLGLPMSNSQRDLSAFFRDLREREGDEKGSTHDIRKLYSCAQELYEESEEYNRIRNELIDDDPNHLESYEPGNMYIQNRLPFFEAYVDFNNTTHNNVYDIYGCRIKYVRVIHN